MPDMTPPLKSLLKQGFNKEVTPCDTEFLPFTFSPIHSPNQAQEEPSSPPHPLQASVFAKRPANPRI